MGYFPEEIVRRGASGFARWTSTLSPENQMRQLFDRMGYDALQNVAAQTCSGKDVDVAGEKFCATCWQLSYALHVDTQGLCDSCQDRLLRKALATPPERRGAAEWALLELSGHGTRNALT